jgi:hypothetical protein
VVEAGAGVLAADLTLTLVLFFGMVSDETVMKPVHSHALTAEAVPPTERPHSSKLH